MGDSITDMGRDRNANSRSAFAYGEGYVFLASADILTKYHNRFEIINRGISGNRIVDLYERIKCDVWNHKPEVLSILIGVNDVWHEIINKNGVSCYMDDGVHPDVPGAKVIADELLKAFYKNIL